MTIFNTIDTIVTNWRTRREPVYIVIKLETRHYRVTWAHLIGEKVRRVVINILKCITTTLLSDRHTTCPMFWTKAHFYFPKIRTFSGVCHVTFSVYVCNIQLFHVRSSNTSLLILMDVFCSLDKSIRGYKVTIKKLNQLLFVC